MIGKAAFGAGFASIFTDPPFPATPPVSSRLRTLSCAITVDPAFANGSLPPV
jgi:hypothetical protein